MGTLQVGGTTLATKNVSTGKVDLSTNADGGLITMFDQFYLENNFSTNNATVTPWTRVTSTTHPACSSLNTGLTQNSGVFSFPENGLYLIQASVSAECGGSTDNVGLQIMATTNNNDYYRIHLAYTEVDPTSVTGHFSIGPALINCTDKNNVKFKFDTISIDTGNVIRGTDGESAGGGIDTIFTNFTAMRIGPSQ